MLKGVLLAAMTVLVLTATAYAEERVCTGVFEMQASGKDPKSISLGWCSLSNTPSAELEKIVKACGHPYDVTHREPPANGHACRVRTIATPNPYRSWDVTEVISAEPTTYAESRRAAEEYLKEQGLLPKR